jgi:hypothetical protein
VQLDAETLGTLFYDLDANQPGGPGVFFVRTPIRALDAPAAQRPSAAAEPRARPVPGK